MQSQEIPKRFNWAWSSEHEGLARVPGFVSPVNDSDSISNNHANSITDKKAY